MQTEPSIIVVYGTRWCGDCTVARRFLDQNHIPYEFVNIDYDREAEQFVIQANHGFRSVPTILFPDGSVLVEPSASELAAKLRPELV